MSHFFSEARRKLKGRERNLRSEASTSNVSLVLSSNPNNPQGDLYSTLGDIGMKVVSMPNRAELDIVFIHGLTGNRETTWTHKNGTFWPGLLGEDITNARIMTFGYDADIVRLWDMAGGNNLRSHGKDLAFDLSNLRTNCEQRPIIFVAHSLGGLVCEQALLICREGDPELEQLFLATRGIIFMGTPHGGSHLASWGFTIARYLNTIRRTNQEILGVLKQNSEVLVGVEQQFQQLLQRHEVQIKIFCFFESVQMLGVGWIVPENSAALSQYPNQSIAGTHRDMTKFSGREDSGYHRVFSRIRNIERQSTRIPIIQHHPPSDMHVPTTLRVNQEEQYSRSPSTDRIQAASSVTSKMPSQLSMSEPASNNSYNTSGYGEGVTVGNIQGNLNMYTNSQQIEQECHQSFRTTAYERHKARNPDRIRGTCQWVLQHPHYLEWYEKIDSAILWVSADPGCGKSVLTKSLIENELQISPFRISCYFFFKDDSEDQRSATSALCAIIHQLFSQRPKMVKHAMHKYSQNGSNLKSNFDLLWEIFRSIVMDPEMIHTEIVCLLDALDECSERDRGSLLNLITTFVRYQQELRIGVLHATHAPLKFFLTSRPVLSIEVHFSKLVANLPTVRLAGELETNRISSEVELFIRAEIEDMQNELGFDSETAMSLQDKFSKFENRTYLWLKLIIDLIRYDPDLATKDGRRRIFDEIPDSVDEAYSAILNKSKDKKLTRKLLAIICVSPRPLTVQEMTIALKIESHHKSVDDINGQSHEFCKRWIRNLCGLFVSIIENRIYLLHQTAKEFLLSSSRRAIDNTLAPSEEMWKHSLVGTDCQVLLSRILLLVVLVSNFGNSNSWWPAIDLLSEAPLESRTDVSFRTKVCEKIRHWVRVNTAELSINQFGYSFFEFASLNWASLLEGASIPSDHEIIDLVWRACDVNSAQCKDWWLIYTCNQLAGEPLSFCQRSDDLTPLHMASILDLDFIFQKMINMSELELNAKGRMSKKSPIWWAALHNSKGMLAKLLDHPEVDVNLGCDSDVIHTTKATTPLLAAVWKSHHASVNLLLDSQTIDINAQNPNGCTALMWAVRLSQYDTHTDFIVSNLLASPGIDVNLADHEGWTPLARAVYRGSRPFVKRLLGVPSINPNCQTGNGDTPLMLASVKAWSDYDELNADNQWVEIMQYLIMHKKTDVNVIAHPGYTALSTAAASGRTKAMEILFSVSTLKVNLMGPSGPTPLSSAVSRGRTEAVGLLLTHPDIEINVRDHEGRTALFLAVFYAYVPVLRLLLAAEDIDTTIKDNIGRTPMEIARENISVSEFEWRQRRHDKSTPGWNCFRNIIELLQPPSSLTRDAGEVIDDSVLTDLGPFELQGTDSWLGTVFMPCELQGDNEWYS